MSYEVTIGRAGVRRCGSWWPAGGGRGTSCRRTAAPWLLAALGDAAMPGGSERAGEVAMQAGSEGASLGEGGGQAEGSMEPGRGGG